MNRLKLLVQFRTVTGLFNFNPSSQSEEGNGTPHKLQR